MGFNLSDLHSLFPFVTKLLRVHGREREKKTPANYTPSTASQPTTHTYEPARTPGGYGSAVTTARIAQSSFLLQNNPGERHVLLCRARATPRTSASGGLQGRLQPCVSAADPGADTLGVVADAARTLSPCLALLQCQVGSGAPRPVSGRFSALVYREHRSLTPISVCSPGRRPLSPRSRCRIC